MAAIRQQISISAAPRVVWRALTTEEGLSSWWADRARIDARAGGRIVLTSEGEDGAPTEERGILHEIRPTRKIEIAWDSTWTSPTKGTRVEFLVAVDGDETRLLVTHSGAALEDATARESIERDWKSALKALRDHLESSAD